MSLTKLILNVQHTMKRHYQIISKIKHSILLSIFCMGLFTLQAQKLTSKDESIEKFKFDLPTDNHFNRKTYQKGTGKSFINFGDILISRAVLPAASFSNGPTSGQHINQGLINQQPVPFYNKQPIHRDRWRIYQKETLKKIISHN
jgi:glycerophosphoryl diester phosphodiesterase